MFTKVVRPEFLAVNLRPQEYAREKQSGVYVCAVETARQWLSVVSQLMLTGRVERTAYSVVWIGEASTAYAEYSLDIASPV